MLGILNNIKNIYFNLACEEFLLKQFKDDIFVIWQSEHSVVVGKHQNTLGEVNSHFLFHENIPVARRLTGGGTVYHGPGNINFSFIVNGERGKLVDFKKFMVPIIDFLNSKDIPALLGQRNEILLHGKKISGNAEHVFKERVLHHGTLLFNADLKILERVLEHRSHKYDDKAVQSVRTEVANIQDHYLKDINIDLFIDEFFNFLIDSYKANIYCFNKSDLEEIKQLSNTKYRQWEWIFGYSPNFKVERQIEYLEQRLNILMKIEKGIITEINCYGNIEGVKDKQIELLLLGSRFDYNKIKNKLKDSGINTKFINLLTSEIF
ncbi:MAG: lipoate--protein ligase [Bacteroidales bacterium]|nr:lipoate--protein ligase [Bacteroidales bacterium]